MGPVTYAKHLISGPRLPFTTAYFGSIGLTLFFAIKVRLLFSLHLAPGRSSLLATVLDTPTILSQICAIRPADRVFT